MHKALGTTQNQAWWCRSKSQHSGGSDVQDHRWQHNYFEDSLSSMRHYPIYHLSISKIYRVPPYDKEHAEKTKIKPFSVITENCIPRAIHKPLLERLTTWGISSVRKWLEQTPLHHGWFATKIPRH